MYSVRLILDNIDTTISMLKSIEKDIKTKNDNPIIKSNNNIDNNISYLEINNNKLDVNINIKVNKSNNLVSEILN